MSIVIDTRNVASSRVDPAAHPYTSDYSGLIHRVREAGLLKRRPRYYAVLSSILAVVLAVTMAAMVMMGTSWWAVALAPILAIVLRSLLFLRMNWRTKQYLPAGQPTIRGVGSSPTLWSGLAIPGG